MVKNECEVIHLTTERIVLREFVAEDLASLVALDSDPEVMRFITDGQPRSEDEVRGFLESCMSGYGTGFGFWAAESGGEFIGWFHFRPDRTFPEEIEVGYRLKQSAWGKGLATEGALALIKKGFSEGVQSVTGRTMKGNAASAGVLEKAGLSFVGEYQEVRWPGADKTALLYRLRSDEYAGYD